MSRFPWGSSCTCQESSRTFRTCKNQLLLGSRLGTQTHKTKKKHPHSDVIVVTCESQPSHCLPYLSPSSTSDQFSHADHPGAYICKVLNPLTSDCLFFDCMILSVEDERSNIKGHTAYYYHLGPFVSFVCRLPVHKSVHFF